MYNKYFYINKNFQSSINLELDLNNESKIYEYIPGFIHAKSIVADDETAVVGTVNMDFRSFYLHFENGVWMCGNKAVYDVKKDFINTLEYCDKIVYNEWHKRPWYKKVAQGFLRLFAPLL